MKETLCGINCEACELQETCQGCGETGGKPFGGSCLAAEYIKVGGREKLEEFKTQLLLELNGLGIEGLPEIKELNCLCGSFVNLAYPLPGGAAVKFLDDNSIYLGTQVECEGMERCFGIVAALGFLLVCEYGKDGKNPELVAYKRR